jgi:hypothetical protein
MLRVVGRFAAAIALAFVGLASPADAAGPFATYTGTWSGSGHIKLDSGKTEALKCKAYYMPKDGGDSIGLALRCASASNKIELRAQLAASGGRVSGSWEERTFNAAGSVSGEATSTHIRLAIAGGGFSGSMSVTTTGASQSISVTTQGVALRGINISMRRE